MHASRDLLLDSLARRQHGVFSRRQVLELGFVDSMISRRLATGAWLRLDEGAYTLTSHPFTAAPMHGRDLGDSCRRDRRDCGARAPRPADFQAGRSRAAGPAFARNARTSLATIRSASCVRRVTIDHIPCLPLVDTVLRLAGRISPANLAAAVDHVLVTKRVTIDELQDRFVECVPRRAAGRGQLRGLLESRGESGFVPATSQLERWLRRMLGNAGDEFVFEPSPPWWPNGEGRVDAYCAPCRLIVEADGRRWHTREADFVRDRRRDNVAVAHGHAVLRFTHFDLRNNRDTCLAHVDETIATRAWRP